MLRMPYNAIQFYLPDILGMSSVEITVNIPITTLQHQIHTSVRPSAFSRNLRARCICSKKKNNKNSSVGRGMEKGVDFIIPFTIPHNKGNKPIHRSGNGNGASIPFHCFNCPDDDPFWKLKNLKTCRTVPDIYAVQSERLNTFNSAFIPEYLVKMTSCFGDQRWRYNLAYSRGSLTAGSAPVGSIHKHRLMERNVWQLASLTVIINETVFVLL